MTKPLLRLLGGLSLEDHVGPIGGRAAQRRRLALLALLAMEAPHGVSRDRLVGVLWPEADAARARHLLRDTLYLLRNALGADAIIARGDALALNAERLDCDVWHFRSALERGDPAAAVAAYGGPFLAGVFLAESHEFELWSDLERQRLARGFANTLQVLAEEAEARHDPVAAVRWWRRLAEHEPWSSRIALRLMHALAAAGERAAALRHAETHAALVRAELGTEPDEGVLALADALRGDDGAATLPAAGRLDAARDATRAPVGDALPSSVLPADPASMPVSTARPAAVRQRATRRARLAAAAAIGALLVVSALGADRVSRGRDAPLLDPRRVVVMPLENRTDDPALDAVGSIAADWIAHGLAVTGLVQVVPLRSALSAARRAGGKAATGEAGVLPEDVAAETGAGIVVFGSVVREADTLRFRIQAFDMRSGRVLASPPQSSGPAAAPLGAVDELRERTLAELAASLNPQLREHIRSATRPPSYPAYLAYAEGITRVIEGDWRGALEPLRSAATLDPSFTLPLVVLGLMHFNLRDYRAADSIAALAAQSRDALGAYDRTLLDGLRAWLVQDHAAAYRAFRTGAELAPGSMAAVQAGAEAFRVNRPREAVARLTALDPTRGELRGDPYYWWELTLAYHQLGEHRRELRAARRAVALLPAEPVVRAAEIRALAALGRIDDILRAVDELLALRMPEWLDPEMPLRLAIQELQRHGHADAASTVAERALAWQRLRVTEQQQRVEFRRGMAELLYAAAQWAEARVWFDALAAELPDDMSVAAHLGVIAARDGRRADAERTAARLRDTRQPYDWGRSEQWRAAIAAQLGNADEAVELLREAVARGRLRVPHLHVDPALQPLHTHPGFRQLLRPAG